MSIFSIRILCLLSTVKTNRYYIPGETSISERLRKRSYDSGTFSLLVHLHINLKSDTFKEVRLEIMDKIINFFNEQDLSYHKRVLKLLSQNPPKQISFTTITLANEKEDSVLN